MARDARTLPKDTLAVPPYVRRFLEESAGLAAGSRHTYERDIERFLLFCRRHRIDPAAAVAENIRAFLATERADRPARAVARTFTAIRQLYRFLLSENLVRRSPTEEVRMPPLPARRVTALTEADMEALAKACGRKPGDSALRDRAVLDFLFATGARLAELLAVRDKDIDWEQGKVALVYAGRTRSVPIAAPALARIRAYAEGPGRRWAADVDDAPFFLVGLGRKWTPETLRRRLRALGKTAEVARAVTPSALRHTVAQQLLRRGADIELVRHVLGWQELQNVEAYWIPDPEPSKITFEKFHPRA